METTKGTPPTSDQADRDRDQPPGPPTETAPTAAIKTNQAADGEEEVVAADEATLQEEAEETTTTPPPEGDLAREPTTTTAGTGGRKLRTPPAQEVLRLQYRPHSLQQSQCIQHHFIHASLALPQPPYTFSFS